VVHLGSDKPQIQTEDTDGIRYFYFPKSIPEPLSKKQNEQYYRSVVYLLQLHIEDKKDLIFRLNYKNLKNGFCLFGSGLN